MTIAAPPSPSSSAGPPAALALASLVVELGGQRVLHDGTARFEAGRRHAVIGRSGAGKSVLMKAALGLLASQAGQVTYGSLSAKAGDDVAFARLRERVVFVHQDPALLDDLPVGENVRFAAERRRREPRAELDARARALLEQLHLQEVAERLPRELSPGLLRRAALARALCVQPEVLIVDEPTTGLDPAAARDVDAALAELAGTGTTLIVITHDLRSLEQLTPELCWVEGGRVAWQGSWSERAGVHDDLDALLSGRARRAA